MTVHSVRIKTSLEQEDNPDFVPQPGPPELKNVLPERVEQHIKYNFNPVLEGQDSPMSKVPADDLTGRPEHVSGVYRFSGSDDKKSLLDSIESKVGADCKWYRVESHVCDHDEAPENMTGCGHYNDQGEFVKGWKKEREKGNVPSEL